MNKLKVLKGTYLFSREKEHNHNLLAPSLYSVADAFPTHGPPSPPEDQALDPWCSD